MTVENVLQVGDFVRNKIHGYTSILYRKYVETRYKNVAVFIGWDGLILSPDDWVNNFKKTFKYIGTLRSEIPTELEKIAATLPLISKAKESLDQLNSSNLIDNLTYIEISYKLTEQEKALKNENKV